MSSIQSCHRRHDWANYRLSHFESDKQRFSGGKFISEIDLALHVSSGFIGKDFAGVKIYQGDIHCHFYQSLVQILGAGQLAYCGFHTQIFFFSVCVEVNSWYFL